MWDSKQTTNNFNIHPHTYEQFKSVETDQAPSMILNTTQTR